MRSTLWAILLLVPDPFLKHHLYCEYLTVSQKQSQTQSRLCLPISSNTPKRMGTSRKETPSSAISYRRKCNSYLLTDWDS